MKKICSALLILLLLVLTPVFDLQVWAQDGTAGEAVTWTLDSRGTLTISGSGEMTEKPWLTDYAKVIKKVVIEEGVTSIANSAFSGCSSLAEVDIASTVNVIEYNAFWQCTSLESVVIPEGITQMGQHVFAGCSNLKEVTLPTSIETFYVYPFSGCNNIENLYISDLEKWCGLDFDDAYLTYDNLYVNGEKITDLVIPEGITEISNDAFDGWTSLERVTMPDSVTSIGAYAFQGCSSLKTVNLSESVTAIGSYVFSNCTALESLTIPAGVLVINSNAFKCDYNYSTQQYTGSLSEIRFLGDAPLMASDAFTSVTATAYYSADNTSWTDDVFQNYGGAITWTADSTIPGTGEEPEITIIASGVCGGNLYWELRSDNVLRVYASMARSVGSYDMDDYSSPEEAPWYEYRDQIKTVVVEDNVASVGDNAFSECENLNKVLIQEDVAHVGANAFSGCTSLEDVNFNGDAPEFGEDCFGQQEIVVRYPADNETWNEEAVAEVAENITLEAHTHAHEAIVKAPTCTAEGYTTHTCSCGDSYVDSYVEAKGHIWNDGVVTTEPTETAEGVKTFTCTTCGDTRTESVPALGHTHNYSAVVTDPTCTEDGYTTHTCSCGDSYTEGSVPATGHSWDAGVVTTAPTSTSTGVKTYTCTACSDTKTETIPALTVCDGGASCPLNRFTDVSSAHWAHHGMDFAVNNGLMQGTGSGNTFEPDLVMSRAMLVTVLWRYSGSPEAPACEFSDVKPTDWFYKAVAWAASEGVVTGVGGGKFSPNGDVTREQLAVILFRFAGNNGVDTSGRADISGYPDANKVASWAKEAVQWAVEAGIISGAKKNGQVYLAPQDSANRAVVATIMMRFIQNNALTS